MEEKRSASVAEPKEIGRSAPRYPATKALALLAAGLILVGAPLAGVLMKGERPLDYLDFPPVARHVAHAPFSMPVFAMLAILTIAILAPFIGQMLKRGICTSGSAPFSCHAGGGHPPVRDAGFPPWGWLGIGLAALSWMMAWTRFNWFESLQPFTFPTLWLGYIVTANALVQKRTGSCMLSADPCGFALLFPISSAFWWFFEYLNRFVCNWYYIGVENFSPGRYVLFASLCFATVLPAVSATAALLASFPRLSCTGLREFLRWPGYSSMKAGWSLLAVSSAGLVCLPVFPDVLFPLLWLAPFMVAVGVRAVASHPPPFPEMERGDWTRVAQWALAALICGFFWEMWNFYSLPKWKYDVPFVNRFHIFEMPLLGYAGYLPFGLECAVVAEAAAVFGAAIRRRRGAAKTGAEAIVK